MNCTYAVSVNFTDFHGLSVMSEARLYTALVPTEPVCSRLNILSYEAVAEGPAEPCLLSHEISNARSALRSW